MEDIQLIYYCRITKTSINTFGIQTKLVRLVTDNAANNIKAFQDLIIPGFEQYFENEVDDDDGEAASDIDPDAIDDDDSDETSVPSSDIDHAKMMDIIKSSFGQCRC